MAEPEAPRVVSDVTFKPSGKVITATPATLQAVLNAAAPGDRVVGDPSTPWEGNWTVTRVPEGPRVILTSSRDDRPLRFVTSKPAPVFATQGRAGGVHWLNTEITLGPTVNYAGGQSLVQLGTNEADANCPQSFVFEQCRIFGNPGQDVRRGILANCKDFAFINGRIEEIHQRGADSQAICGWSGSGPFLIRDAYAEAAGENVMFGGSDAVSSAMAPADITLERVHLRKPLEWKGKGWTVKNIFELKHAKRVKLTGVLMENCWAGEGQSGYACVLTPRNQSGTNPYVVVEDVTLEHVEVRNSTGGVNLLGSDDLAPSQVTKRILFRNVLLAGLVGGRGLQLMGPEDVTIERMTATGACQQILMLAGPPTPRFVLRASVLVAGTYGIFGDGVGGGIPAITKYLPGAVFDRVILQSAGGIGSYPAGITVQGAASPVPAGLGVDLVALQAAMTRPTAPAATLEQRVAALEAWKALVQERIPK